MTCESRTHLLNQLCLAVAAYNQAVSQMTEEHGGLPYSVRERVRQVRDECHACRVALIQHEREHGCSLVLATA